MTGENTKFYRQSNTIRLKMQIKVRMENKSSKKRYLKVNISKMKRKFENFRKKNYLNWSSNDRRKCRILRNSTRFDWRIQSKCRRGKGARKNGIWKKKFAKLRENLRILGEKIVWIRVRITGENTEFYRQSITIRLKMQIKVIMENQSAEKRHLKVKIRKIESKFQISWRTKFHEFQFKWQKKLQNFMGNSTRYD